jgi:tetratricopeptide (TPR) repeat protein
MRRKAALSIAIAVFLIAAALPALGGGLIKASSKNPGAQKLIDQAWALSRTDSNAELFKQCVTWMEQADKLDPDNPTILIDISIYYWEYGDSLPKQTPEQKKNLEAIYARGLAAAEKSIKLKESPPAVYWAAVNKAAGLEFSSIFSQAAAFPELYRQTHYVIDRDPDYDYGAPGRLWSEILSRVPKKVVEIVGRKYVAEAMELINAAIKQEPRFLDNYNYKARFMYIYFENRDEALKLLDTELKTDPNGFPEEAVSNRVAQRTARQLWKKITGKEYPQK